MDRYYMWIKGAKDLIGGMALAAEEKCRVHYINMATRTVSLATS